MLNKLLWTMNNKENVSLDIKNRFYTSCNLAFLKARYDPFHALKGVYMIPHRQTSLVAIKFRVCSKDVQRIPNIFVSQCEITTCMKEHRAGHF